jgi:predicted RNase H-like nuclease
MKFIGVDLGWRSQPTGLSCLHWQLDGTLRLTEMTRLASYPEILEWIDQAIAPDEPGIIAVDAPTLIPNLTGMRLPDRLSHTHFGKYHAGCYPANLGSPFAAQTVGFGLSLETRGFRHAPTLNPKQPGRYQIEVYPHAAIVHLFQLSRILKYKKGRLAERRPELVRLRQHILNDLPLLTPSLSIEALPEVPHRGNDLKALEDQLDSLICAYTAAHWWLWGGDRNLVLGDRTTGYIIIPTPHSSSAV